MKTVIAPNAVIETTTPAEMEDGLRRVVAQQFQEMARGVQIVRFSGADTVAATNVQIPATGEDTIGPRTGFIWQLAVIRQRGLTGTDTLTVWRNSSNSNDNYLGTLSVAAPVLAFQKHVFLTGGEKLIVVGAGLAATGDITVNGEGLSAAELDLYKLI